METKQPHTRECGAFVVSTELFPVRRGPSHLHQRLIKAPVRLIVLRNAIGAEARQVRGAPERRRVHVARRASRRAARFALFHHALQTIALQSSRLHVQRHRDEHSCHRHRQQCRHARFRIAVARRHSRSHHDSSDRQYCSAKNGCDESESLHLFRAPSSQIQAHGLSCVSTKSGLPTAAAGMMHSLFSPNPSRYG